MTRTTTCLGLVVAASVALAGCSTIPTSGPVGSGEVVIVEQDSITLFANDPEPGAGPEEIISGFLQAVDAGVYDEYQAARNHLTSAAATGWDPRARVVVYRGVPEITEQEDGTYLVDVEVDATIDNGGRYAAAPAGSEEVLTFEMTRTSGNQWRIATPPAGALITTPTFEQAYRRTPVYFASQDRTHLVPDVRWFPARYQATAAVEALLSGASPWLRDAVVSGAPQGARLSATAVTVLAGVADVDLTSQVGLVDPADRALLQTQLEATLGRLPGVVVDEVRVTVGGVETDPVPGLDLVRDPSPDGGPYLLSQGASSVLDTGQIVPVRDVEQVPGATALAVEPGGRTHVVLDGTRRLLLLPEGSPTPVPLLEGRGLVRPSVDRYGWIWTAVDRPAVPPAPDAAADAPPDGAAEAPTDAVGTADGPGTGALTAVRSNGLTAEIGAEWLADRTVRSVRVARDGSRVAVVSVGADGGTALDVAAVVRTEAGAPRMLGEPMSLAPALVDPREVVWVDEATLAVLARSDGVGVVHLVPVTGPTTALSSVEGAASIAAGRGERSIYVVTDDGRLLVRQTRGWSGVAEDITDITYPG